MVKSLFCKATCAIVLLACACDIQATVIYSDSFARSTVSDADHTYTEVGKVSVSSEVLRLTCPKDGTSGRNYVVGNYGLRNSLNNIEADSVEWLVSMRENYNQPTTVLNGFDVGQRGVACILVMDGADPLSASGYALTYGGTGAQQYCLCSFAGGLNAQSHLTPVISGSAATDANKKYWSFRIVYVTATGTWRMYQHIADSAFPEKVSSWTSCGEAVNKSYTQTPLKHFGWLQNYTGTIDYTLSVDNYCLSYYQGGEGPGPDPEILPTTLQIKGSFNGSWQQKPLQLVGTLEGFTPRENPRDSWTRSGSYRCLRTDSTGFYYVKKIDGRWWLIDPDGYANINRAVSCMPTTNIQNNYDMCSRLGYNASGNFLSSEAQTKKVYNDQNYRQWGFARRVPFYAGYGKIRHKYYPETPAALQNNDTYIFALDPMFARYCDSLAQVRIAPYSDERDLVGWFTDNEISFQDVQLQYFVRDLPVGDTCRTLALEWAAAHGLTEEDCKNATAALTTALKQEFVGYVGEAYYKAVYEAVKKHDPNHLVMGSRLHGRPRANMYLVKASHKYTDITSVNFYDKYQPNDQIAMESWTLDHPCIVGEFYVKDIHAQTTEQSGAGWYVNSQRERGYWYQHVVLQLLRNKCYIGWQYFRYGDDPDGSNKGITSVSNIEYTEMTPWMQQVNDQVYALTDYIDGVERDTVREVSVLRLGATADTYIEVGTNANHGSESTLSVQYTRAEGTRREAFVRFDLPAEVQGYEIRHAELSFTVLSAGTEVPYWMVSAIDDTTWNESTLTGTLRTANPAWKSVYGRLDAMDKALEPKTYTFDLTNYLHDHPDGPLNLKLHALNATTSPIEIASREYTDQTVRPQLTITYRGTVPTDMNDVRQQDKDGRIYTILGQYVGEDRAALQGGVYVQRNRKIVIP